MKTTFAILLVAATTFFGCAKHESSPNAPGNTTTDSIKNAVKGWVEAINTNRLDDLDKYIANDMIEHASLAKREGTLEKDWLKGIKRLIVDDIKESPDNKYVVEDIAIEGNICAVRAFHSMTKMEDSSGVQTPRKKLSVSTLWLRWENGKFVEIWGDGKD